MEGQEPFGKRDLGVLEDGALQHGKLLLAVSALPDAANGDATGSRLASLALRREEVRMVNHAAVGTDGAVRPADALDQLVGFLFVGVLLGEGAEVDLVRHRARS